jgi:AcrR family transcriptional regulator
LEVGPDRLTIRLVSNRCGYQAPTIYHHFGDKAGLIDQCLEQRFQDLLRDLERVPRRLDAAEYLLGLSEAVVRFGIRNPEHYRLFSLPRLAETPRPASGERAYALVADAFEELEREGRLLMGDAKTAFEITWATIHGLIALRISRPDYEWSHDVTARALEALERGLFKKGIAAV